MLTVKQLIRALHSRQTNDWQRKFNSSPRHIDKKRGYMDKEYKKLLKKEKAVEKDTRRILSKDKARDALVEKGKMAKKGKC